VLAAQGSLLTLWGGQDTKKWGTVGAHLPGKDTWNLEDHPNPHPANHPKQLRGRGETTILH
jgi:hypothetical protein